MEAIAAPALGYAPDRAIRARFNALFLDGLILGFLTRAAIPALGIDDFASAGLAALLIQFLYFFLQEAATGKTLGKRVARIRVVQLDGAAPTPRQLAIRNALRIFDALPLLYASGLVSVMWTGPGRRQRLGDRVAGTAVILEPRGKAATTPGWLLPTLTIVSVLASIVIYGALYNEYRAPSVGENALAPAAVAGFVGDNSLAPGSGTYTASASQNGVAAIDRTTNKQLVRSWQIVKACSGAAPCNWKLTRTTDTGSESGMLVPAADGWHVSFPTHSFRTRCPGVSGVTTALRRATFVIHFDQGGRSAVAHEVNLFHSDRCGEFAQRLDWSASLTTF